MRTLSTLRKLIGANQDPENVAEVRSYIEEHLVELGHDLGVTTDAITKTLSLSDDAVLATRMLATVKKVQASQRDHKRQGRTRAAQAAADDLASRATWEGDRVPLDLPGLLSSVLTKRSDLLVIATNAFTVSIYQGPLFDIRKVKLRELTAFVDSQGLHFRWRSGGLNLRSQVDPCADRIVMNLSRTAGAVAA